MTEKGLEAPDKWRSEVQAMIEVIAVVSDALRQLATEFCKALGPVRASAIWFRRCALTHQLTHRWHLPLGLASWVAWHLSDILILRLPEDWVELRAFPNVLD